MSDAYGFALFDANGAMFFHDGMFNARFYKEESLAANNSGTQYSYPELAGKTVQCFVQASSVPTDLINMYYVSSVDYTQGYPRVTLSYPTYHPTPTGNPDAALIVFVVD